MRGRIFQNKSSIKSSITNGLCITQKRIPRPQTTHYKSNHQFAFTSYQESLPGVINLQQSSLVQLFPRVLTYIPTIPDVPNVTNVISTLPTKQVTTTAITNPSRIVPTRQNKYLKQKLVKKNKQHKSILSIIKNKLYSIPGFQLISKLSESYHAFSSAFPFICAMLTGGTVLTISDFTSQKLTIAYNNKINKNMITNDNNINKKHDNIVSYDYRRTFSMFIFGFLYYGIIAKKLYLFYDYIFGMRPLLKAMVDCIFHTTLLLVPAFYFITGIVKGQTPIGVWEQLKVEYKDACGFSILYWIPLMSFNFKYCSQETRILFITCCSFIHKSALSWFANRTRMKQRIIEEQKMKKQNQLNQTTNKTEIIVSNNFNPITQITISQ